ncbi:MAG: adenylate cyclase [Thermoleophilaceae bacterium]|nr:adenylate cyclase [Thermoleophilaceae bacterium]
MGRTVEIPAGLHDVVERLSRTGWAAEVVDDEWRLVWISGALRGVLGDPADEALGIGLHASAARECEAWRSVMVRDNYLAVTRELAPTLLHDGKLPDGLPDDVRAVLDEAEPGEPLNVWSSELAFAQENMPPTWISFVALRLRDEDGESLGTVFLYGPDLPAPVLALVARGDRSMFERMAALLEPARRPAAILFADIEASGRLSRHLPTAAYFELVREIRTSVDDVVIERCGLVGKHAGDGVTAFFIAEQVGSDSAAARAAIEAGRAICDAAAAAAERVRERGVPLEPGDVLINVGMHWGSGLYVGQVVTGGRLEVTALGDEVNEAARIEQTASEGAVLASKTLVERLDRGDAEALDLDPATLVYVSIDELPDASEKAVRDAGTIAVTDVRPHRGDG